LNDIQPNYYDRLLQLVRLGRLIAIDNVLWSGQVIQPDAQDPDICALRELNQMLHQDQRVSLSRVSIADGLTLAQSL
jgi:predicted O-methyltransferase YrrM